MLLGLQPPHADDSRVNRRSFIRIPIALMIGFALIAGGLFVRSTLIAHRYFTAVLAAEHSTQAADTKDLNSMVQVLPRSCADRARLRPLEYSIRARSAQASTSITIAERRAHVLEQVTPPERFSRFHRDLIARANVDRALASAGKAENAHALHLIGQAAPTSSLATVELLATDSTYRELDDASIFAFDQLQAADAQLQRSGKRLHVDRRLIAMRKYGSHSPYTLDLGSSYVFASQPSAASASADASGSMTTGTATPAASCLDGGSAKDAPPIIANDARPKAATALPERLP